MKTTLRTTIISLAVLCALSALLMPAHASGILSLVASTDKPLAGKTVTAFGPPALNNQFSMAFVADFSVGSGIFAENNWVVQTGQVVQPKTLTGISSASAPGFNDSGTVSFWAQFSGGDGIFTQNGILAQTGQTIAGFTLAKIYGPTSLNNFGEIVFIGQDANGNAAVLTDTSVLIPYARPSFRPALNDSGYVAAVQFSGNGDVIGDQNGQPILSGWPPIAGLQADMLPDTQSSPFLNTKGTVVVGTKAFDVNNAYAPTAAILTPTSVIARIGDVVGGELITSLRGVNDAGDPVINGPGTIAFAANFSGGSGIFTRYGQSGALIAKSGDIVDGKVIHEVDSPAINAYGSVAFRASFTDGSRGIVEYSSFIFPTTSLTNLVPLVKPESLRLTAAAPASGSCAADLGFADNNGNPVGPSLRVNLTNGQTESSILDSGMFGLTTGQRVEVRPLVTPLPGAPSQCGAIAEVVDNQTGLTSIVVPGTAASSAQPHFPPMGVALGQTLQLDAVANGSTPCSAELSFLDSTGRSAGTPTVVNLLPGHAAFLDISAKAPYQLLRPIVTPVPGAAPSTCSASAELFDQASGRTLAYAAGQ